MKKLVFFVVLSAGIAMASNLTSGCTSCHGTGWEKAAMGKSLIVKNMSQKDISTALKGYKANTYGGAMKSIMVAQVLKQSDAQLDALAAEIKSGK